MTKIISVSLTDGQSDFLSSKKISPSGIFQEKVMEIMKRFEQFEKYDSRIESLQKESKSFYEYLDDTEHFQEYLAWRKQNVLEKQK